MKICDRCEKAIEDDDVHMEKRFLGYCGDERQYQDFQEECECGGYYSDTVKCVNCGEYFPENDAIDIDYPLCRQCLSEFATVENAITYAQESIVSSKVYINDFFSMIFSENEIFEILKAEIMKNPAIFEKAALEYCLNDINAFSDYIRKEQLT